MVLPNHLINSPLSLCFRSNILYVPWRGLPRDFLELLDRHDRHSMNLYTIRRVCDFAAEFVDRKAVLGFDRNESAASLERYPRSLDSEALSVTARGGAANHLGEHLFQQRVHGICGRWIVANLDDELHAASR